jgi:hypothetical protein
MGLVKDQQVVVFYSDGRKRRRYSGWVSAVRRVNCEISINIGEPADPRWATRTFRMDTRQEQGGVSGYGWSYQMPEEVERSDRLHVARNALKAIGLVEKYPHAPELTLDQLEQLAAVAATFPVPEEGP